MKEIRLNKSAARALDVLVLFSQTKSSLTLREICLSLAIPSSSGFELVQTLLLKGFLEVDDPRVKSYRLGLAVFEVGIAYLSMTEITQQARPLLENLNKASGGTAFLGVEDKGNIVYLDKAETYSLLRPTAKLGSRKLMHSTSLGKSLLAAYSKEKRLNLLSGRQLVRRTPYTKTELAAIMEDLEATRQRGYAIDNQEDHLDMFCIGAPVYDHQCRPVAAVSVGSLFATMTKERQQELAEMVIDTALKLSRRMGYSGTKLYEDME